MVKIKVWCIGAGPSSLQDEGIIEIEHALWNNYTSEEKEKCLRELSTMFVGKYINFGAYVIEGEK